MVRPTGCDHHPAVDRADGALCGLLHDPGGHDDRGAVAQPQIMEALGTDVNGVVWVTSAYLLTTRCAADHRTARRQVRPEEGLSVGPAGVHARQSVVRARFDRRAHRARSVQGLGAALITPQTMAVITGSSAREARGDGRMGTVAGWPPSSAAARWCADRQPSAGNGSSSSISPLGSSVWYWPATLVPDVETHDHRFDLVGVGLSAVGVFALVFGIQEGEKNDWAWWIWSMIAAGVLVLACSSTGSRGSAPEPLVPLELFGTALRCQSRYRVDGVRDLRSHAARDVLPATGRRDVADAVRGDDGAAGDPHRHPRAIVGRILDRVDPRLIICTGLGLAAISMGWLGLAVRPETPSGRS